MHLSNPTELCLRGALPSDIPAVGEIGSLQGRQRLAERKHSKTRCGPVPAAQAGKGVPTISAMARVAFWLLYGHGTHNQQAQ